MTITIKDKEYPLLVSYRLIKEVSKYHNTKKEVDEVEFFLDMIWMALEDGCFAAEKDVPCKKEELERMPFDQVQEAGAQIMKYVQDQQPGDNKKKVAKV